MSNTEIYLLSLMIIFGAPYLVWRIGHTEYVAPLVVVQILMGVVLGPAILGAWQPDAFHFIFSPAVLQSLNNIATWAVILFVWTAGIELDLQNILRSKRETTTVATVLLIIPLLFGSVVAIGLLQWDGWKGDKAKDWQFVLGIGMSCAVTALPILMLFMEKIGILRTSLGQRVLRYASIDDIAVWAVLTLILMDWSRLGMQGAFLIGFALASLLIRYLMIRIPQSDRLYVGLIWLTFSSLMADWSGLHFMVGAFLAGLVLDISWFDRNKIEVIRENILILLMPVFFLSTGLRTYWQAENITVFLVASLLLIAAVSGKLIGARIVGHILDWQSREASMIGWLLQTKALIMIIFANILLDKQLISSDAFASLLLMAVGSTMLTIPCVTKILVVSHQGGVR